MAKTASVSSLSDFEFSTIEVEEYYEGNPRKSEKATSTKSAPRKILNRLTLPNSSQFLQSYINLSYYIGVCPFKIIVHNEDCGDQQQQQQWQHKVVQRNFFQTTCCAVLYILGGLTRIQALRDLKITLFNHNEGDRSETVLHPIDYFEAAEQLSLFVYYLAIFIVWWMRSQAHLSVLSRLDKIESNLELDQKNRQQQHRHPLQIKMWLTIPIVFCWLSFLTRMGSVAEECLHDWTTIFDYVSNHGRSFLFIPRKSSLPGNGSTPASSATTLDSRQTEDHRLEFELDSPIFFAVFVLSHFAENMIMCFGDYLLIILAVLFFRYISDFAKRLNSASTFFQYQNIAEPENLHQFKCQDLGTDKQPITSRPSRQISPLRRQRRRQQLHYNVDAIFEEFEQIRCVGHEMNGAVGILEFALTLGSLPFFTANFLRLLSPQGVWLFLNIVLCFSSLFTFMVMAAKVNKKAQVLEQWLGCRDNYLGVKGGSGTNRTSTTNSSLGIGEMMAVLAGRNIGFSGAGLFVFTMDFLGAWICLLLTFAMIMIQMKAL